MLNKFSVLLLGLVLLSAPYVFAESESTEIVEVVLARDILNLEPQNAFEPSGFCGRSEGREHMIPIVHSKVDTKVCLWTKVKSPTAQTLRHTWFKAGIGWEKMAEVSLKVQKSESFRTWSCKKIAPGIHNGKWMVVINAVSDPETALCKVDLEIKE